VTVDKSCVKRLKVKTDWQAFAAWKLIQLQHRHYVVFLMSSADCQ